MCWLSASEREAKFVLSLKGIMFLVIANNRQQFGSGVSNSNRFKKVKLHNKTELNHETSTTIKKSQAQTERF